MMHQSMISEGVTRVLLDPSDFPAAAPISFRDGA